MKPFEDHIRNIVDTALARIDPTDEWYSDYDEHELASELRETSVFWDACATTSSVYREIDTEWLLEFLLQHPDFLEVTREGILSCLDDFAFKLGKDMLAQATRQIVENRDNGQLNFPGGLSPT